MATLRKSLKISAALHRRLLALGVMGETFEDVLGRVVEFYESKEPPRRAK